MTGVRRAGRPEHGVLSFFLSAAFLCSGAAALLFEALFFRLAGLALGNGVVASSTVLAAFMVGLALGNLLAARFGERVARPLLAFARLEAAASALSLVLVLALPWLASLLAPALAELSDRPLLIGAARAASAFVLLLLPATAMGATLPLLARALAASGSSFGVALGRLYGWNTLGGVLGALASETLLVPHVGLVGAACCAAGLQLVAALVATALDRSYRPVEAPAPSAGVNVGPDAAPAPVASLAVPPATARARLLGAALLCGGLLLALEVVWFRFLQLFVFGTQRVFSLMLAVVLAGIGLGSLLAAAWLARRARAAHALPVVALLGGVVTITAYAAFETLPGGASEAAHTLFLALRLMLPSALVSGVLFTLTGDALRRAIPGDAAAAGWLTLANTLGAAAGATLAGLVLLPWLGVERSLFLLAGLYGVVAQLLRPWAAGLPRLALVGSGALFALVVVLFPFGLMQGRFLRQQVRALAGDDAKLVAVREGPLETAILLQTDWGGAPLYQTLMTNAHSMTSSLFYARRYMKLFAYWPLALRPESERALLISYGLGNTAEALVAVEGLREIDVVDLSPTVLGLSPLVQRGGAPDPLADPRVRVHVEDGRFFLERRGRAFDVITAEPPPPRAAGVANLYSLEYFRLVRARLRPGGIATHWLPVNQLTVAATRAIVRAFCIAFEDCSLWSGAGYDWMLAGTNGAHAPPVEGFARLWARGAAADLREVGVETPAQLGSLFLADAEQLAEWVGDARPVVDAWPGPLGDDLPDASDRAAYRSLQDAHATAARFRASDRVARLWPEPLRREGLAWFAWQGVFNRDYESNRRPEALAELWAVLEQTPLATLPLLQLDSEPRIRDTARRRLAEGGSHPVLAFHLAAAALAERRYEDAARFFGESGLSGSPTHPPQLLRALALGLLGRRGEALAELAAVPEQSLPAHARPWRDWLRARLSSQQAPAAVAAAPPGRDAGAPAVRRTGP